MRGATQGRSSAIALRFDDMRHPLLSRLVEWGRSDPTSFAYAMGALALMLLLTTCSVSSHRRDCDSARDAWRPECLAAR